MLRIIFCHGLGSSTSNRISTQLTKLLADSAYPFEALKYPKTTVWRVGEWQKALEERLHNTDERILLIGQSAGANPVMQATIRCYKRVAGIFLVSPGYDVNWDYIDMMMPGSLAKIEAGETVMHPASRNGEPIPVDLQSFRLFRQNCVSNIPGKIPVICPVSIVHGTADPLVPLKNSQILSSRLGSSDICLTVVPGGTHFLSMDDDIVRREFFHFLSKLSASLAGSGQSIRSSI